MEGTSSNGDAKKEESRCFVCDAKVQGRYYALATCKTQNSRSRVIEKLGELVGERYMVVISEDDVICRNCANLINTLDRLEIEMCNVRDHVLRFLEQKYSLKEGELLNDSNRPKLCQPPQITKCNTFNTCNKEIVNSEVEFETCIDAKDRKKQKRSHSWLQCNKCKYTTHFNIFTTHRIKDNAKQKILCDKCGLRVSEDQKEIGHNCRTIESEDKENEKDNSTTVIDLDTVETSLLPKTQQTLSSIQAMPSSLIGLSNYDDVYVSNILSAEDNLIFLKQPMYVLQSVDSIDGSNEKIISILESNSVKKNFN